MKFIKIIGIFRNSVPLSKDEKRVSIKMITWLISFREKWTFTLIIKSNPEGATLCGEKKRIYLILKQVVHIVITFISSFRFLLLSWLQKILVL
jgi:hypothetical protein